MATHKDTQSTDEQTQAERPSFGSTENKDLAGSGVETKEQGQDLVSVEMIHHGSYDGEDLLPGTTYQLPKQFADTLVANKRAKSV